MINHWLVDEITKIAHTRNEYGDFVYGAQSTIKCRFREINDINRSNYKEYGDSDAMIWVAGTENFSLEEILIYNGQYYKVEQINNARKGFNTSIDFKVCLLTKHLQVS